MSETSMNPTDSLVDAATRCADLAKGDEAFTRIIGETLRALRQQLEPHITEANQPDLMFPVAVQNNGKWLPGAVLTFADHAVVAWISGGFRQKTAEVVLSYQDIKGIVDGSVEPATRRGPEMVVFSVDGDVPVTIRVPRPDTGGANIPVMLRGVLAGSVTFNYDSPQEEPPTP
jgi:hypothetical protein